MKKGFGWMKTSRARKGLMGLHLGGSGLQPNLAAEIAGTDAMSAAAGHQLIGKWPIIEADLKHDGKSEADHPTSIATALPSTPAADAFFNYLLVRARLNYLKRNLSDNAPETNRDATGLHSV